MQIYNRKLWFAGYLQTYLERDVRQLRQIGDLMDFQRFLELLASLNGQILIEVKLTSKINTNLARGLFSFSGLFSDKVNRAVLVNLSGEKMRLAKGVDTQPFTQLIKNPLW